MVTFYWNPILVNPGWDFSLAGFLPRPEFFLYPCNLNKDGQISYDIVKTSALGCGKIFFQA